MNQRKRLVLRQETIKILRPSDIGQIHGGGRSPRTARCGDTDPPPTTMDNSYFPQGTCA